MNAIKKWITPKTTIFIVIALLIVIAAGLMITGGQDEGKTVRLETPAGERAASIDDLPEAEATPAGRAVEADETAAPTAEPVTEAEETPVAEEEEQVEVDPEVAKENLLALREPNLRITNFNGRLVQDALGEDIGRVEELLVGVKSSRAKYAVINPADRAETGTNPIPIPYHTLQAAQLTETTAASQSLVFNGPVALFINVPALISPKQELAQPGWDQQIRDYWETTLLSPTLSVTDALQNMLTALTTDAVTIEEVEADETGQLSGREEENTDETTAPPGRTRAGAAPDDQEMELAALTQEAIFTAEPVIEGYRLIGRNVVNNLDQTQGQIIDLLVGTTRGRINYAVVALAGQAEKLVIIPFNVLNLTGLNLGTEQETIPFELDPDMLENAPGFEADQWPNTAEPEWDEDIFNYWEEILVRPDRR